MGREKLFSVVADTSCISVEFFVIPHCVEPAGTDGHLRSSQNNKYRVCVLLLVGLLESNGPKNIKYFDAQDNRL